MKLLRFGPQGQEKPGLLDATGTLRDLSGIVDDIAGNVLSDASLARLREVDPATLPAVSGQPRIGPCVGRVGKFICIGLNYADHAAESGLPVPSEPVVFNKWTSAICGPNDDIEIPRGSVKTDWEVELGVVIGRRASYLESPAQARDYIAGYVTVNDLSERTFQLEVSGGQWSKGKSCAGFCPTGPYLVTPDEVDAGDLRLRSWVNGEIRQDSSTRDLIFGVEQIIYDLSQFLVLEPGDLVCTGTPEGVALSGRFPYLKAGDVVDIEVAGLGRQRQEFFQG